MKLFNKLKYFLIAGALVASCSSSGTGSDGGDKTFMLNVSVNPSDAGTVSPATGEFDEGEEVTVQANADFGFGFVEWTGDIQSTDNPLTVKMDADTDITANFEQTRDTEYAMTLVVEDDSSNSQDLAFGQRPDASSGLELGTNGDPIDREAPPPPAGGMHNFFKSPTHELLRDFRNSSAQTITWNLQLFQSEGDSLFFNWTLDETFLNGSLILRNNDSSISVDMLTASSLRIGKTDADSLLIEYELGGQ